MTAPTTLYRVALGRVAAFATAVAAIALFPSAAESLAQDHGAPWAVSFGSKHYDDAGYSIAVDHDGSAVVAGRFRGVADFDPGPGECVLESDNNSTDIFVLKLGREGSFVWAVRMGGRRPDWATSVALDDEGNILLTGSFSIAADFDPDPASTRELFAPGNDAFVLKLDGDGRFLWAAQLRASRIASGLAVVADRQNRVIVTGDFMGTADFDPGPTTEYELTSSTTGSYSEDVFVWKLDANGSLMWAGQIGGLDLAAGSLAVDRDGSVFGTGAFIGTADFDPGPGVFPLTADDAEPDVFLFKWDGSGRFLWANSLGGPGNDWGIDLAVDREGNVHATGYFQDSADFDPAPDSTAPLSSAGTEDVFVSKFDGNGNFLWARGMGGAESDSGCGITVDVVGGVFLTGWFRALADFDPGPATSEIQAVGGRDIFLSKLDAEGTLEWAAGIGNLADDLGVSVAVHGDSGLYATGAFRGTLDFDPGPGTCEVSGIGQTDVFVLRLPHIANEGAHTEAGPTIRHRVSQGED